jgi:hypothetical protein
VDFAMLIQRTSLATDNVPTLISCQKNKQVTFEVTFVSQWKAFTAYQPMMKRQRIMFSTYW